MAQVLLIHGEEIMLPRQVAILKAHGHLATSAETAKAALTCVRRARFDVLIVDIDVLEGSVTHFLRGLAMLGIESPLIVMTSVDSLHSAAEAVRSGARDLVRKPVVVEELVHAIERALHETTRLAGHGNDAATAESHAAVRWARIVCAGVQCRTDPRTLHLWAREIGVSYGALRNWCRRARLSAKDSLRLTRLLRAIILREKYHRRLEEVLDVVDIRTLRKLLERAGIDTCCECTGNVAATLERFLAQQSFIDDAEALTHLRANLRAVLSARNGEDK